MGMGPVHLYTPRARDQQPYEQWRDTPIGNGGTYEQYQQWLSSLQPGATPGLGQTPTPTPIAPPPSIPNPTAGPPAYAPPQVQMPALLANPRPQGLGGMPLIRDRMMATTMTPFAQPNWGIQQVNPAYLTQTVRLPGGNVSGTPVSTPSPASQGQSFGNTGAIPSGWAAAPTLGNAIEQAAQEYLRTTGQQPGASQLPVGLGGMRIPRQPAIGLGTK